MEAPLVTVVCMSYNHEAYVYQALCSIRDQRYSAIQLIIADDASTDGTVREIERFIHDHPYMTVISLLNEKNTGNCSLFNQALRLSKGKYVIDLAADDYLYENCIDQQVTYFESQSDRVGVIFTNIDLVNSQGVLTKKHYPVDATGRSRIEVPQGNVYEDVLKKYFIFHEFKS